MSMQTKSLVKPVYKVATFEELKEIERLREEFPSLKTVVEQEENIRQREILLGLI